MSMKKKGKMMAVEDSIDAWLMTYADMITLLLCFFVILLSVSEPKKEQFEKLKDSINSKFATLAMETPFQSVYESLQVMIEEKQAERNIAVEQIGNGLQLELSSSAFFPPGSAELRAEALPVLEEVAKALGGGEYKDYTIDVEGYTDDVPIATSVFPSNWELSAARAASVVKFLISKGLNADHLRAIGYADTRAKVPNLDASGEAIPENREINRRVSIRMQKKTS